MTTEKIREQLEKLKTLADMQLSLKNSGDKNAITQKKIEITREEMLKCTYNVGKLLKEIESKV